MNMGIPTHVTKIQLNTIAHPTKNYNCNYRSHNYKTKDISYSLPKLNTQHTKNTENSLNNTDFLKFILKEEIFSWRLCCGIADPLPKFIESATPDYASLLLG